MKHISTFTDRHGRTRHRFRKAGCRPAYLKSEPGTAEFEAEYRLRLGETIEPPPYREPSSLVFQLDRMVTCEGFDASGAYIYFVEAENSLIKIGFSYSLRERFKTLQTCSPLPLKLLGLHRGDEARERQLHRHFANDRARGEWFNGSDGIRLYAASTNGEQRLTILANLEKMAVLRQGGDPNGVTESRSSQTLALSNDLEKRRFGPSRKREVSNHAKADRSPQGQDNADWLGSRERRSRQRFAQSKPRGSSHDQ